MQNSGYKEEIINFSISVGIASTDTFGEGVTSAEIVKCADDALLIAKREGRNQLRVCEK
jgi:PleD family two-component response regulator